MVYYVPCETREPKNRFFLCKIPEKSKQCCPVLLYFSPPPPPPPLPLLPALRCFIQSWASPKDKKSCGMGMLRPSRWPPSTAGWAWRSSSWTAWKRCVRRAITNRCSELVLVGVCFGFILRLVELQAAVLRCFFCWRWRGLFLLLL